MTLYEMSFTYEQSADLLRQRMRELQQAERRTTDSRERRLLHQRMAALEPLLRERFNIPENLQIVALLVMGYATDDCEPHPEFHASRKPLDQTVFYGSFENLPQVNTEREQH